MNTPQHPARMQQGLEAPAEQGSQNPYVRPNEALVQTNDRITGARELQLAQAQQAGAQAGKAEAEANILRGLGAMGAQMQAGPQVTPQQVEAEQVSRALANGEITPAELQSMVQQGQMDPGVAEAAMGMAEEMYRQTEAQFNAQPGLGQF